MKYRQPLSVTALLIITAFAQNASGQGTGLFSWATQPEASVAADTVEDGSLTFRAYVDGRDMVGILPGYFYYVHQDSDLPVQQDGEEFPTYVNGEPREIEWQQDTGIVDFNESIPLSGDLCYSLEIVESRGLTSLTDVPASAEGAVVILMNDRQFEEGAWYEWRLRWSESPPWPVDENQIYWAGYLNAAEQVIAQIQGGQFRFLDSESVGNAALAFGSNLPAHPVDVAVLESLNGLEVAILEQPRPWNDHTCYLGLTPSVDAEPNTHYELLLGWGEPIEPGPAPTPAPLPVADTENINTPAYFPDIRFRLAVQDNLAVGSSDEFTAEETRAILGELEISDRDIRDVTGLAFFENITALSCSGNAIADLDIAGLSTLVSLVCTENRLSELDLSGNPALQYLDISNTERSFNPVPDGFEEQRNHLQHLDLSNNPQLIELRCDGNDLGQLDTASNPELATLSCRQNELSSLDLTQNPALRALDVSNFDMYYGGPDAHAGNQFRTLDVTHNSNLEVLSLSNSWYSYSSESTGNEVSTLNISQCPELRVLKCFGNRVRSLDLSGSPQLRELNCGQNRLTRLNVSQNPLLEILSVYNDNYWDSEAPKNTIRTLNLENNPKLRELACHGTSLTALDTSDNPQLEQLTCGYTQIAELDLSSNPMLRLLDCYALSLTVLDLASNPLLETLYCYNNQLTELDVSRQPLLRALYCGTNQLTILDVSGNPRLYYLDCSQNTIADLDLSAQARLQNLQCSDNALTELTIGASAILSSVDCRDNRLTEFPDVRDALYMQRLDVRGNLLDEQDCPEITAAFNAIGKAEYYEWDTRQDYLIRGFAYTPQKDGAFVDCGLEPTPIPTATPAPTATPVPEVIGEQEPIAASPEAVGVQPLTGDVNLWAENGGGSRYWRPEADTLSNGNAIVLGGMRTEPGPSTSSTHESTRDMRERIAIFSPTGELLEPSRAAFYTDAGLAWEKTICTSRNDDKFLGLCADTVGGRSGARYVVHTIANPDAFPDAFPNYPPEQSREFHTAIQVVSNEGVAETPLINPWGDYVSEPGLIRGGMVRFLSNGNIVVNFEDRTNDGPAKEAFYEREGNRRVVGAVIVGPDGSIVKAPFAISKPSGSRNSENRFGLTSGDGWFAVRYYDAMDGPTIVAFDNDGNELGGGEGRLYPAIDIPELQSYGGNRGDPNGLEAVGDKLYITHRGADRRGYLSQFQVDENGVTVLKTVRFTDHPLSTFQHNADLGVDSNGNAIVMWQDQSWERFQTGRWEMLARLFDSELEPVTSSFCIFEVGSNLNDNEMDPILGPGRTKQGRVAMNDEIIIAIAETNEVPHGDAESVSNDASDLWYTYTFIARVLENPMRPAVTDWEIYEGG